MVSRQTVAVQAASPITAKNLDFCQPSRSAGSQSGVAKTPDKASESFCRRTPKTASSRPALPQTTNFFCVFLALAASYSLPASELTLADG